VLTAVVETIELKSAREVGVMFIKSENTHDQSPEARYQREINEHYSTLINRIPVGIYLFVSSPDGSMRFDFVSAKFCEILNIPEEKVLEDALLAFTAAHPEDFQSLVDANDYAIKNVENFFWEGRFVINGKVKWMEINSEPNCLSNGDILWTGMIKEITEQRRLEAQFNQAQKMEAVGTLVGGIAHDFNNMLAGIAGNVYMAKEHAQRGRLPDVVENLRNVEVLSYRAADMVQKLLTFARKGKVEMKPLPLEPFTREIMRFIRSTTPENIRISLETTSEAIVIEGDETLFHQVLMNLINNARDAVEGVSNPVIRIKLGACQLEAGGDVLQRQPYGKPGNYAHLEVSDNGCGFSEERIPQLFEPFYTTKREGKGTGLGLAMVFGAIKSHHGFIDVKSVPGEGSSFHLYLPLLQIEERKVVPLNDTVVHQGQSEMILFVDDNISVRRSSKVILESMSYKVMAAADGLEAIELFNRHKREIDLVIIDVVMPRMGGVEAVEHIRKIRPDIKVIYSTGYDREEALKGKSLGNDIILSKPYNIQDFSLSIRKQLS